ncbi:pyridoxal phosphate-dependent aminotransferase [Uliginosibacterium sediminicola]|uniref:Aminotransferase n=1 Tax=Uliginosibacterium sediminicola TaxID=2024550 RepID=A0ABU9YX84_9RHOO
MSQHIAQRARNIPPFHVMELLARAQALQAQGRDIIHMEVGEPDFPLAPTILEAAQRYLAQGRVDYTPAAGLPALREAIARHYAERFGVAVSPERILVTAGASGALMLAHALLTEPGDHWLLPDPGYPCNQQFVRAFSGLPQALAVDASSAFQPRADQVAAAWTAQTRGIMLASPANPTGTLIAPAELARIHALVKARGGSLLVDEIYQGLSYGTAPSTALSLGEDVFVINSFSKYFGMTGWRLGWLVAPQACVRDLERLAQHYTICASAPAQHTALAAFSAESTAIFEARRAELDVRRRLLLDGLEALGLQVPARPEGAFYAWADVSAVAADAAVLARRFLEDAGVATTPGIDFVRRQPERWLRLAYTTEVGRIEEALRRMRSVL